MKITEIEAIAMVWPPPEKQYWTALRPIGRVSELIVRVPHGHRPGGHRRGPRSGHALS